MCIREPAADRHCVLWVEDVRCWRIVNDDGFFQVAPNLREILYRLDAMYRADLGATYLDIVALMIVATLAEEPMMHDMVDIKLIEKWITVLRGISMFAWFSHLCN